ncbi:hypothetical protein BDD12DRAFT_753138 [Trichophaea hybrida]|nr:hypothetical protein BDD12DRAFT_753138 [Trichophaea hybrida]
MVCDRCWEKQLAHYSDDGRVPHEKCEPELRKLMKRLNPSSFSDSRRIGEIAFQASTKWFGVRILSPTDAALETTSRFNDLSMSVVDDKFPSLLSFVGETGAGKSTLISALLGFNCPGAEFGLVESPLIGSSADPDTPTSCDVHLFADPSTANDERPRFYADCEGMDGGNYPPLMAKTKRKRDLKYLQNLKLRWVSSEHCSRSWMVKNLYPRSNLDRTLESVLSRLIKWADTVLETAVNQPLLPYAIVAADTWYQHIEKIDWWNDTLTMKQLDKYAGCIHKDPELQVLVNVWAGRQKRVTTLLELIQCYYSGIKIVCIPRMSKSPPLFRRQYQQLNIAITEATELAKRRRIQSGLLMNSEQLATYLNDAFNHYSKNLYEPFNFLQSAFQRRPVEAYFQTHIIQAAYLLIRTHSSEETLTARRTFTELAPLLASSILLDVCRKGKSANIDSVIERYDAHFRAAVREFCQETWPCSFIDNKGRRCVNVSTKHQKGHQIANGKVVAAGGYVDGDRIHLICEGSIKEVSLLYGTLLERLDKSVVGLARCSAVAIQAEVLARQPYSQMWSYGQTDPTINTTTTNIAFSHHTCFGCLFSVPTHALPCAHVLCDACIQDFSEPDQERQWVRMVRQCPLCGNNNESAFDPPWNFHTDPRQASPRVLSLDG